MFSLHPKATKIPPSSIISRFKVENNALPVRLPFFKPSPGKLTLSPTSSRQISLCKARTNIYNDSLSRVTNDGKEVRKSFWGAVGLIIGTAVGPGMLGLPAATIKAGIFPSTFVILLCWVYVISSIILLAELSVSAMEEDGVKEVSFTGLATKAFGNQVGGIVALVYASLNFSLMIACVSGIGSVASQCFPSINFLLANALYPLSVGFLIVFFPFDIIDNANRILCFLMLSSLTVLVFIGLPVARCNLISSIALSQCTVSSILPAIPVAVLTLGFHVITPFICRMAGHSASEAINAILIGGAAPLMMVLLWNMIVLGLSNANITFSTNDPISLLLAINPSTLPAVKGFAFSALATSLIGYTVSFPKQLLDTWELIFGQSNTKHPDSSLNFNPGKVAALHFTSFCHPGMVGLVKFHEYKKYFTSEVKDRSTKKEFGSSQLKVLTLAVLVIATGICLLFPSSFSKALDFAGIYGNCFLFGMLPPAMAYVQQSRKNIRSVLPGGNFTLLLLFITAVILGIWH